ncbi:unnamed protein product [Amoebophrya sp. A120]|nr:unnamed protein product [Amoebophrya sp. A120]|eukprot:GSA120T00022284001.1
MAAKKRKRSKHMQQHLQKVSMQQQQVQDKDNAEKNQTRGGHDDLQSNHVEAPAARPSGQERPSSSTSSSQQKNYKGLHEVDEHQVLEGERRRAKKRKVSKKNVIVVAEQPQLLGAETTIVDTPAPGLKDEPSSLPSTNIVVSQHDISADSESEPEEETNHDYCRTWSNALRTSSCSAVSRNKHLTTSKNIEVPTTTTSGDQLVPLTSVVDGKNDFTHFRSLCEAVFHHNKQSYWKPRDSEPANIFEKLADEIYDFHMLRPARRWTNTSCAKSEEDVTTTNVIKPVTRGGAEWWVQVRDDRHSAQQASGVPPPSYSYNQGASSKQKQTNTTTTSPSLGFHWDQDYGTAECPFLGTVTYLDNVGAPTVVLDYPKDNEVDEEVQDGSRGGAPPPPSNIGNNQRKNKTMKKKNRSKSASTRTNTKRVIETGFVSHPEAGKHLAFQGNLLHGVPEQLQKTTTRPGLVHRNSVPVSQSRKRITFLVNLWPEKDSITDVPKFDVSKHFPAVREEELRLTLSGDTVAAGGFADDTAGNIGTAASSTSCQALRFAFSMSNKSGGQQELHCKGASRGAIKPDTPEEVITDRGTPVCGLTFDNGEEEQYELWLPVPSMGSSSSTRPSRIKHQKQKSKSLLVASSQAATSRPQQELPSTQKVYFQGGAQAPCYVLRR